MSKLKVAIEAPGSGYVIQQPIVASMINALKDMAIDYVDVDPFVSSHSIDENNNGAIDAVPKETAIGMRSRTFVGSTSQPEWLGLRWRAIVKMPVPLHAQETASWLT